MELNCHKRNKFGGLPLIMIHILTLLLISFISANFQIEAAMYVDEGMETCSSSDSETCVQSKESSSSDHPDDSIEVDNEVGFDEQWENIRYKASKLKQLYIKCEDNEERCSSWASMGECDNNPHYMRVYCRKSCMECVEYDVAMGELQNIEGKDAEATYEIYKKSVIYKKNEIVAKPDKHSIDVQISCINNHALCAFWAAIGECTVNPSYMKLQCGPSCRSCHLIDINNRCPLDPNAKDALGPYDMGRMFLNITDITGPFKHYEPVVHSHPSRIDTTNIQYSEDPIIGGPWIVTFEKFHTFEESDRLIELGAELGYKRSTDVGKAKPDGTYDNKQSKTRTSTNAWCTDQCYEDPLAKQVYYRIGNTTGISDIHHENLQLLQYEENQFYGQHHDFIPHHVDRQCGPRILTFFLYLSDVEEGGETRFPLLQKETGGLKIAPKKGRALLWPSILDEDPNQKDFRTEHEAMPVIKGLKYGANAWIHLRDFKTPNDNGCV